jgi:hypothetical protein
MAPSNIEEFAKRKGCLREVRQIDRWLKKMGKRISGGVAIGKNYDTLVLDIEYQDAAIYYDIDDGELKVYNQDIKFNWKEFKEAVEAGAKKE